ncbi:unnamed protein product [Aphanomyces euteiches]
MDRSNGSELHMVDSPDRDEVRRAKRRHRSKINQRKYRAWQRAANVQLEHDVAELDAQTKRLEAHLVALQRGERFHAEVEAVQAYFDLFKLGYDHSERQKAYLRHFLVPTVWWMGQIGIEHVMAQWEAYSASFDAIRLEMCRLDRLYARADEVAVHASILAHLTPTVDSIATLFPSLPFAHKLMDKTLRLPIGFVFVFGATKRVIRLETNIDLTVALMEHLGSVDDVALALEGMRLGQDAKLHT